MILFLCLRLSLFLSDQRNLYQRVFGSVGSSGIDERFRVFVCSISYVFFSGASISIGVQETCSEAHRDSALSLYELKYDSVALYSCFCYLGERCFSWIVDSRRRNLILDPSDSHAANLLDVASGNMITDYDGLIKIFAENLKDSFVVLYNHRFIFESLRFELPRGKFFDCGHNVLFRNEALRVGGVCWRGSLKRNVKLDSVWVLLLRCHVPKQVESLLRGMVDLYQRVEYIFVKRYDG